MTVNILAKLRDVIGHSHAQGLPLESIELDAGEWYEYTNTTGKGPGETFAGVKIFPPPGTPSIDGERERIADAIQLAESRLNDGGEVGTVMADLMTTLYGGD